MGVVSQRRWQCFASCIVLASIAGVSSARAQVVLPGVDLGLPKVAIPVDAVLQGGVARARVDARRLRLRQLLHTHADRLTSDPRGEVVIRGELLAVPSTSEKLQPALAQGYGLRSESRLEELGLMVAVLEPPRGTSLTSALRELRRLDPDGHYDYHHLLSESGETAPGPVTPSSEASALPATARVPSPGLRVGMIDGGVLTTHLALASVNVRTKGCNGRLVPSSHGTAVAALLVATVRGTESVEPSHRTELLAADVYCDEPTGGAVASVVSALSWMAHEGVPVVNVSLVGPRNAVLEQVVARMVARGHVLVAAVGNDGPAAPPLYPAAYEGVVGATAVDRRGRVLLEAGRGEFVDFAALGADLDAATVGADPVAVRGTSFAAPTVTGLLALRMPQVGRVAARAAVDALAATAIDLGARGRDPVYGFGWVAPSHDEGHTQARRVMSTAP